MIRDSTIIRKITIPTNKPTINTIIPLILGNFNNKYPIGAISIRDVKRKIMNSKSPIVNCVNKTDIIEKKPHTIEIARKLLTKSGSDKGPFARINRGKVKAASF